MWSVSVFDYIAEINHEALSKDGYDDCIIGLCYSYNGTVIAYDRKKMIDKIAQSGNGHLAGMGIEEAEEFFEYNIQGDYAGNNAPVFITRLDET